MGGRRSDHEAHGISRRLVGDGDVLLEVARLDRQLAPNLGRDHGGLLTRGLMYLRTQTIAPVT